MTWQVIDPGAGNIQIIPPNFYAATGSVKTNHTQTDIVNLATAHGLHVFDYREGSDDGSGYKPVAIQAQATSMQALPWAAPFPFDLVDRTHVTAAWWSPPTNQPSPAIAPQKASSSSVVVGVIVVAAAAGAAVWWLFRRR